MKFQRIWCLSVWGRERSSKPEPLVEIRWYRARQEVLMLGTVSEPGTSTLSRPIQLSCRYSRELVGEALLKSPLQLDCAPL